MGVRNLDREAIERLEAKSLDARFTTEIQQGLNCSPFEAEAVLDVVKEVYVPFLSSESPQAPPGKLTLIAVAADEPAGKPVSHCKKQTVCLTPHRGEVNDRLIHQHGPAGFRQARLLDLCQQALSQGALLTAEDLAYRVFFVTPRTISRDLQVVRQANPDVLIPMRSTLHDLGPVLTHRTQRASPRSYWPERCRSALTRASDAAPGAGGQHRDDCQADHHRDQQRHGRARATATGRTGPRPRAETPWQEHQDRGQGRTDDRSTDLLAGAVHGRVACLTLRQVPRDVLDDHHGVVDDQPDGHCQFPQRHQFEGVAGKMEADKADDQA